MFPDAQQLERLRRDAAEIAKRWHNHSLVRLIDDERGLSRELDLLESACRRYRAEFNGAREPDLEESRMEYDIRLCKVREALYSMVYPAQGE